MKPFLTAWARGVSIFAFYICLSIVVAVLAFIGEVLPPAISIPLLVVLGPAVIYWASRWLAPDLFGEPRHMNSKQTALVAVVVTGFCATVLGAFTTTPEVITQLIVGTAAFLAAGIVLLVLFWTPWLRALPPERQHRTIWIAAGSTGLVVCLLPLVIGLLTR